MLRPLLGLSLLPLVACSSSGLADLSQSPALEVQGEVIEGEFIISADVPEGLAAELGLLRLDFDEDLGAGLYQADSADLWTLQTALKQKISRDVLVEPNRPRVAHRVVNDSYRSLQWNFDMLGMNQAWDRSTGAGVVVAVIDSGVSTRGGDAPLNVVGGWDYVGNDSNPSDENGHGTHVAGTIAQATDNNRGVAGIAFDAQIMPVRVLDRYGSGSSYAVAQGIDYAVRNGADVINMSLGSFSSTSTERDAIARAVDAGVIVVAASGNEGYNQIGYPAAYPGVIAVGAVDARGDVTRYSNGGTGLDVVAPGGDLSRDRTGDGYADGILQETITGYEFFEGTSMASPHVAGIAALLISAGAHPDDVDDLILGTAKNGGQWSSSSGYGLVDPVAALDAITGGGGDGGSTPPPTAPTEDTQPPEISDVGGTRSGRSLTIYWTTDEPATTAIEFEGYGVFSANDGYVTDHEMRFTIDSRQTYEFTILAEDAAGNVAEDGVWVTSP